MSTAIAVLENKAESARSDAEQLGAEITELCSYSYAAESRLLTEYRSNKRPIASRPRPVEGCLVHFASRVPRKSSPNSLRCTASTASIAHFPAYARSQTSRYPVEAVSDRNMGKAGNFR